MFRLRKWYLDVVTDDGRAFLGYWAALRWGLLSLHYHGTLYLDERHNVHQVNRFRRVAEPQLIADTLTWNPPGLHARWHQRLPALHERLLERDGQYVDWHCVMPRAQVEVKQADHGMLHGLGYAERLEMTLPPWRLPLQQLHWGRFLSPTDSFVWIHWLSPTTPLTLVYHNGSRQEQASVDPAGVHLPDHALSFTDSVPLRTGALSHTVLAKLGWLLRLLLPARIRRLQEQKWRSRSAWKDTPGWAIHEVVTWP